MADVGSARARWRVGLVVAVALTLAACEGTVIQQVNDRRWDASVPMAETSDHLILRARAHSRAMCSAGAVAPSPDLAAAYLGEGTTFLTELVGRAPLPPAIADLEDRNQAAADAIWVQWEPDPRLTDPRWDAIGVGEHECADGNLYSTLVLRQSSPPIAAPADTTQVQLVETVTQDGWTYSRYRNRAYPCSIGGYQTFVIGTKVGSTATATRPLWVKMRGGGAGWFDSDGSPLPTAGVKSEESLTQQLKYDTPGLMASVKAAPEGFRTLIVSMCSHDVYAGSNSYDPYNANLTPQGTNRPTTGLTATKAAIQFTRAAYPTDDYFLHGTSAGAVGTFHVAWALQQQGIPPTGFISDAGVINQAWQRYVAETGISGSPGCEKATEERGYGLLGRIAPEIGDPANEPHLLLSRRALTVPAMHVYNQADSNQCGNVPIPCPLPDGTTVTLWAASCNHELVRRAIEALPASAHSDTMGLCVEGGDAAMPCDRHVTTTSNNGVSSAPGEPADYQAAILTWVRARLADD
jgi:hypothetical protein